jgi:RNA polymerase sigma-70 factor (ECF subfamily)
MLGLYCGNDALGEELAQDALERACRDWRRVGSKDDPAAYVRRSAINLANSYFRRKAAERRALARLGSRPSEESSGDAADAVTLRQAVAALPRRQKTAIVLRFYADLSFPEVAESMDIPLSTAKSLVGRAVARLRTESTLTDLKEVPNG